MTDLLIDTVVAQYQVLSRLGGGAMGVVYKARDLKLGRYVALKFLPHEWSHDDDAKQRFVREAQAASSTDHANICTVHDIQSTDDGRLFIVMAFYDGESLKQRLARGPLPVTEALDLATQVADGLARAHAAGVVHRDVKPGNVMLTEDAAKIVDFGLATLAGSVQLTQAGSPMGTVTYMAPEQLRGLAATPQSDVWAVGVMLYEMLSGHPPFQGAYAEAISYAIRHETPPPLREGRPDIGEAIEQLVFRALHKEPGVRFASGRELARALRQVQGHSVPLDLQTAAIEVHARREDARPRPRRWRRAAVAVALVATIAAVGAWFALRPRPRTFIAVAPVVNRTGDPTLDPYRLGLTLALTRELGESADLRVLPYVRLLPPLRRFLAAGADVSSPDAARAIGAASGAAVVVIPTLLYDRGAWKARADLQQVSGPPLGRIETQAIESSLTKDAAATLIASLAAGLEDRFRGRRWVPGRAAVHPEGFQSLDAAQAFEEGVNAYDAGEIAAARDAFARAAREDPRHPLPAAWASRIAQIVGDRNAAAEAADRAEARLERSSRSDRLFVEAVVAEARRQDDAAERLYTQLAEAAPDDPGARLELAGFLDRHAKVPDAIAAYRRVLELDGRLPGPALELCRLYNSTRVNDPAQARSFGERARKAYAAFGSRGGEAQSMLCLSDVLLRVGTRPERTEARQMATQALGVFESLNLQYSLARAHLYVATAARAEDDLKAAAAALEKSLASARQVGNTALEGSVLVNLGVTYNDLGQRASALDYYRQSYETAERRGDERRAAYSRANAGAVLIEYGTPPDEGLRFVEGALRVARARAERNLEVFCLQLMAVHYRFVGRTDEARRTLADAMNIARERGLGDRLPSLLLEDGRTLMEMGEYVQARDTFDKALASEEGGKLPELLIEQGRLLARMGDLETARTALESAKGMAETSAADIAPRLAAAFGELAYAGALVKDARLNFEAASRRWTGEWPDAASVGARAYVGFIDGLDRRADGPRAVAASVQQAARMKRPSLEALARVLLARLELHARRPAQATSVLAEVAMDGLSPELRAQVHYWRGEARNAQAPGTGQGDLREAQRWFDEAQQRVPADLRERYLSRPELQAMAALRKRAS